MRDVNFAHRPGREELETYVGMVAWLALEASRQAKDAQVQVLDSRSPEQLAAAVASCEKLAAANALEWARLAEQIRSW
jgi:hypothetical protein